MRKKSLWTLGLVAVGLLLAACAPDAEPGHPAARRRRREAAEGPLRAGVLGGRRGLRDRAGRHPVHRHPLPPPQGPRPHAQADPRQHAARDRLDDRAGGGARGRHGAHGLADLGARPPAEPTTRSTSRSRATSGGGASRTPTTTWSTDWDAPITIADTMVVPTGRDDLPLARGQGRRRRQDANGDPDFQVIHSFWVPAALRQAGRDAGPARTTSCSASTRPAPTRGSARSSAGCSTGS